MKRKLNKWLSGVLAACVLFTTVPVYAINNVSGTETSTEVVETSEETQSSEIETSSTEETNQESFESTESSEQTSEIADEMLNINPTNLGDEEEPSTDNWELGLVFYDSTVDNGKTPLTSINWHATTDSEERVITTQITYENRNRTKDYSSGELEILIPDLSYYYSNSEGTVEVAADKIDSTEKNYEWSYERTYKRTEDNKLEYYYRFINNNELKTTDNFEGSIQISYKLESKNGIKNSSAILKAYLINITESNEISFKYTGDNKPYSIELTPQKINSYDGLPSGDYIWVNYSVNATSNKIQGIYNINRSQLYIKTNIPENCIILDNKLNLIEPYESNEYRITDFTINYYPQNGDNYYHSIVTGFYIGYPTEKYQDQTITESVELYGFYNDKGYDDYTSTNPKTIEKVAEANTRIKVNEFIFKYEGELYGISKSGHTNSLNSKLIKHNSDIALYLLGLKALYTGKPMTVRIGDDLLFYENQSGDYEKLTDQEYRLSKIKISRLINGNFVDIKENKYNMALFVRYANTNDYVQYGDAFKYNPNTEIIFEDDTNIVGWYLEIYDLEESIDMGISNVSPEIFYDIQKPDIDSTGKLHNFAYLQVYIDGNLQNEPDLDSYANFITKDEIASYDQNTYGTYMQRATDYIDIKELDTHVKVYKTIEKMQKDIKNEIFFANTTITPAYVGESEKEPDFKGYTLYDLLPKGMELNGEISTTITSNIYKEIKYNNKYFATKEEYLKFIEDHLTITITENYRNSGRTMLKIVTDFSDCPLDLSKVNPDEESYSNSPEKAENFIIPIKISYDSYLEYGATYENIAYSTLTYGDYYMDNKFSSDKWYDNGSHDETVKDIDNDGNITEILYTSKATATIIDAVSTHQSVTTYVMTDQNNYTTGIADASCNSEYKYKLLVRTGISDITNMTIYTSIEEAQKGKTRWKGEFLGVDTSYAENKGYTVKVWYSENTTVDTLHKDSSWKEYSDKVDKTKVKSLAFQYLNQNGKPATLPENSMTYVLVKMKSPSDESITTLARMDCWTQWNALDDYGQPVDFITGINSNIVKVALPNSVIDDELPTVTLKFIKEISGTDSDFENMLLDKAEERNFKITLTSLTANEDGSYNQITGLLSSTQGLTLSKVPIGTYLITESDDIYFDFVEMIPNNDEELIIEGVTLEKTDQGYVLTISDDLSGDVEFNIKVTNKIEPDRPYEDKEEIENLFKIPSVDA